MDAIAEREGLQALLTSEGWSTFLAHVEQEWGPLAFRQKINAAIHALPRTTAGEDSARLTALEVEAATRQIEILVSWPKRRAQDLEAAETVAPVKEPTVTRKRIVKPEPRKVEAPR